MIDMTEDYTVSSGSTGSPTDRTLSREPVERSKGNKSATAKFIKLTSSRNVERMRKAIEVEFGFMPTPRYCKLLIEFVEESIANKQE